MWAHVRFFSLCLWHVLRVGYGQSPTGQRDPSLIGGWQSASHDLPAHRRLDHSQAESGSKQSLRNGSPEG